MPTTTRIRTANTAWSPIVLAWARRNGSNRYLSANPITNSANRFQYPRIARSVKFSSEVFDMNVDNITKRCVIKIPKMTQEVFTIDHLIGVPHEVFEQA